MDNEAQESNGQMPFGQRIDPLIRSSQVEITEGGTKAPAFDDDAAASLVYGNYERAKAYLETNSWLLEWQASEFLYNSPNYDQAGRVIDGRPVRISRFLVAKNTRTMSTQVRRGIFGNQKPFVLQPEGDTDERMLEAWTHLIWVLMKRAKFEYNLGLLIESQVLKGTGLAKPGWEEKTVVKKRRKRKAPEPKIPMPIGGETSVPTEESDAFETVEQKTLESWPFFEFRPLGTTLYDPKWRTPNAPEESADYVLNIDFGNFRDLQQLRQLDCYKNLPDDETMKAWFLQNPNGDAMPASTVSDGQASMGSVVANAAGEHQQTSEDPFDKPLMIIEMLNKERVQTILSYEGRYLTIRNEEHDMESHALGYAANWWNTPNSGLGLGVGRLNSGDQRILTAVTNESLKMIAYPMNAPILYDSSAGNAPTQNVMMGMGTFWGVRPGPGGDVGKALQYMRTPEIPPEAWKFIEMAETGGQDLVGANSTTMQGNLGGPGSSAMRTAAGVNRVGGKADENIADPLAHLEYVIERFIDFLVLMVRTKMPLSEIREILKKKYSEAIIQNIDLEGFLNFEFSVDVLCGQKLQAKQAIMQLIPFLLQIVQQPQLMDGLHETGRTVDFVAIEEMFVRLSELEGNDNIFREMTPKEEQTYKQNNPAAQKVQGDLALEQARGQNKMQEVQAKGQTDMATKLATIAAEHAAGAVPLDRAEGLLARRTDEQDLEQGV
jgi:hypothetical protein